MNIEGTREDDFGAEVGGPIVPGKAFFFGAIDPQSNRTLYVGAGRLPAAEPGSGVSGSAHHAATRPRRRGRRHRRSGSTRRFSATRRTAMQRAAALHGALEPDTSAFSRLDTHGGHNQAVSYEGSIHGKLARRRILRAGREQSSSRCPRWTSGRSPTTRWSPISRQAASGSTRSGIRAPTGSIGAKVTNLIGDHQIHYGVLAEHLDYLNTINRMGPTLHAAERHVQTATGAEIDILS